MTTAQQAEALKFAAELESIFISEPMFAGKAGKIAAELRRLHALSTRPEANGWQPLGKAPDTHRTVLVHLNIGKVLQANFLGDLGWDWQELDEEDGRDVFVTHWREMPAPPAPEALEVKRAD